MIAAGEAGGILDAILRRLAAYMEKAAKLKAQVKGAMTYPIVTLIIAVLVLGVILVFVIPVFEEMFADFGGELPVPTQIVVAASEFISSSGFSSLASPPGKLTPPKKARILLMISS